MFMYMPFNKRRVIENIYFLAKEKGLKLGDIEKNAGVSPGYLSRINKSDNTSIPSVDLIYYIAQQLGVSVDTLLGGYYNQMTRADKYVLDFVQKVIDDTRNDKIEWKKLSAYQLQTDAEVGYKYPMFEVEDYLEYEQGNIGGVVCKRPCYVSGFFEKGITKIFGNGYVAKMDSLEATIYLMSIEHEDKSDKEWAYELYVGTDSGVLEGICNSNMIKNEIAILMEQLYETLEEIFSHVKLSKVIKNVLDKYMHGEV